MILNRFERWVVNNPIRILEQHFEIAWFKKNTLLKEGSSILEIGCGRGAGAKLILKKFQPSRLSVLDLDINMVKKAKVYLTSEFDVAFQLIVGDALTLPFEENSFDGVFGFGFLHHVEDWRGALGEVARVLKGKGIYYIEELFPELYQNLITRHLLVHPEKDRFGGVELRQGLEQAKMPLQRTFELKKIGILGIAVKQQE